MGRGWIVVLVVLDALTGCHSRGTTETTQQRESPQASASAATPRPPPTAPEADAALPRGPLIARLDAGGTSFRSDHDVRLTVTIENRGDKPEEIDLDMLGTAIFGVDVIDDRGARVPTIPPGVPPLNYRPRRERLAPGATRRVECEFAVFSPSLAPGAYTVRLRDRSITAGEIRIVIASTPAR